MEHKTSLDITVLEFRTCYMTHSVFQSIQATQTKGTYNQN